MRRLSEKVDPILDDLRTELEEQVEDTDESWDDIVSAAMNSAWDRLKAAPPTGESA